jgi:hypothetical protein
MSEFTQLVRAIQSGWGSPYPHREPDPLLELFSMPLDGKYGPHAREEHQELSLGLELEER